MLSPALRYILSYKPNLLLDNIGGVSGVYSLRKLKSSYKGACLNVRRSSDGAEMDIGFAKNELDTTALLAFVGSGSGTIAAWYDQSGNGYNATQTNTSYQPRIVNSGVLDAVNNKPSIYFNGSSYLVTSVSAALADYNIMAVVKLDSGLSTSASTTLVGPTVSGGLQVRWVNYITQFTRAYVAGIYSGSVSVGLNLFAFRAKITSSNVSAYKNGVYLEGGSYSATFTSSSFYIGCNYSTTEKMQGNIPELIIADTAFSLTSNVDCSQKSFYNIT